MGRIFRYHQILTELDSRHDRFVSSKYMASILKIDDTQVRKDISLVGFRGKPKSGYSVHELKLSIAKHLGIDCQNAAVLIGAGRLGSALVLYPGFSEFGLKIVAVLDNDPERIGSLIGDFSILPLESLSRVVNSYDIGMAILSVPKQEAQTVCDTVVSLGIAAIWNFAPLRLNVPAHVVVRNENLAVGLALLSHHLKKKRQIPENAQDIPRVEHGSVQPHPKGG